MIIYRYFEINQGTEPYDAISGPDDYSLAPSEFASGIYFLQENLQDQWVDPIQPLGMDAQLIADWNMIMTTARRSYYMNVHNIIVAIQILSRAIYAYFPNLKSTWVNFRPGGAGGKNATVLEFNGSPTSQFNPGTSTGMLYDSADGLDAYPLPSVNQANIPASVTDFYAAFQQILSVSPTIAQVRAYLDNLDLPGVMNQILGYLQMQAVLQDPNGYKYPFYKQMAEYAYGAAIDAYLLPVESGPWSGYWTAAYGQNAATDNEIVTYCSGSNALAQQDAAKALAQMDSVQQDMYNFAGQLNAFVNAPNASSDLQAQLQKENTMPALNTYLPKPVQIVPPASARAPVSYNVKPVMTSIPDQVVGSIKNHQISTQPPQPVETVVHPGGTPGNLGVINAANISQHTANTPVAEPAVAPTSSDVAAGNVTHRNAPTIASATGSQTAASAPVAASPHHVASMGILVAAGLAMLVLL